METDSLNTVKQENPEIGSSVMQRIQRSISKADQGIGILSVLGAVVLWSSSYVVTKIGVGDIPPLTFAAIRFVIAAILMGALALTVQRLEPVPAKDLLRLALGGLLGITAYFSLQNLGVQRTSAADATLLVASFPVITLLLEILFRKAQVNFRQIAGIAIAIGGIYLVIDLSGAQAAPDRLEGNLLLLATGLAWALYNFATQNVVQKYSTFTVIFWQTLFGMAALLPLALTEALVWQPLSAAGLLGALYLGVFCSVGAFLLYGYGLKSLQPGLAVNLLNLVPVFGLLFAVLLLQEKIGLVQILGGLIVIGGVTLSVSAASRTQADAQVSESGRAVAE
jgi:drug/metabolite transporter (DMT)-like permease